MAQDGSALRHCVASVIRVVTGFVIGSLAAFATCCAFWAWAPARNLFGLTIELFRPIPPIAFIPFAIFFLGLGDAPAIFLVSLASYFPMYAVTMAGFDETPPDRLDVARTFGAGRGALLRYVAIPAALPSIAAGLRTSAGISWFVVIVAELVGAQTGLGYLVQESRLSFDLDRAVAAMVLIALSGLLVQGSIAVATGLVLGESDDDA